MKQSNTCPKCKSTDVVRIKAFTGTSTSNTIQLSKWGSHAYFDRYVCVSCGFIEHYIHLEDKAWLNWLNKQIEEDSLDTDFV